MDKKITFFNLLEDSWATYWEKISAFLLLGVPYFFLFILFDQIFWSNEKVLTNLYANYPSKYFFILDNISYVVVKLFLFFGLLATVFLLDQRKSFLQAFKFAVLNSPKFIIISAFCFIRIILWSFLLIVPGILAFGRYLFVPLVYLLEKKKVDESFHRSRELGKLCFMRLFDYTLLICMVIFVVGISIHGLLNYSGNFWSQKGNFITVSFLWYLKQIFGFATFQFVVVFYYLFYQSLKN